MSLIRKHFLNIFINLRNRLFVRTYRASEGLEYFISIESIDEHIKYGFVRLRFNNPKFNLSKRLNCLNDLDSQYQSCALIRELHVYGSIVKVDSSESEASQHFGIGKRLLQEAERIALDAGYNTICVISGVGVRNYYRKRGYTLGEFGYMFKQLRCISEANNVLLSGTNTVLKKNLSKVICLLMICLLIYISFIF